MKKKKPNMFFSKCPECGWGVNVLNKNILGDVVCKKCNAKLKIKNWLYRECVAASVLVGAFFLVKYYMPRQSTIIEILILASFIFIYYAFFIGSTLDKLNETKSKDFD